MQQVFAPGRVNLIGEHIDYHGLPVLPMALRQGVCLRFEPRRDAVIRIASPGYGERRFEWRFDLARFARGGENPAGDAENAQGDWENYVRAAALAVAGKWGIGRGIEAEITSDLPAAAGLSSSSALLVAVALGLLRANDWHAGFDDLMAVLPEGEQFVGTRGGGMDHAAILASREGFASLVSFDPPTVRHVPIPPDWAFLVIDSGVRAEKSGAARERYNSVRQSPAAPGFVKAEAARVSAAVAAMQSADAAKFGALLLASHAGLRDVLQVSHPELDRIVGFAMQAGALGARLTGAGFGGSVVALCHRDSAAAALTRLSGRWRAFEALSGPGALL